LKAENKSWEPLLLIQAVELSWGKADRGSRSGEVRQKFPQAFPVPAIPRGEAVLHRLHFHQQGTAFLDEAGEIRQAMAVCGPKLDFSPERIRREIQDRERFIQRYRVQAFPSLSALNLTNLAVKASDGGYRVSFFYDQHRSGAPYRRGRNQDYGNSRSPFFCKDCLNEPAFTLLPGQYGRLLWNERRTDCDTGEWYYLLHIYNLYSLTAPPPEDLLTAREPDFLYRQLAELY